MLRSSGRAAVVVIDNEEHDDEKSAKDETYKQEEDVNRSDNKPLLCLFAMMSTGTILYEDELRTGLYDRMDLSLL